MTVPPLLDLCLFAVCKNLNGSEFLNTLPDFLRQRLCLLFRQEKQFQDSITNLNFAHCTHLLNDEVRSISSLKNITCLNLSHCEKLNAIALSYLTPLTNLETLILNHCPQVSMGFCFLAPLTKIKRFEIAFCEVQDPLVPFITSLKNINYLNLMCNRLTDEGCAQLAQLTELTWLSLSMNPLVPFITSLKNINYLNLMCNRLTDEGCAQLAQLTELTWLSLSMNPLITDETLKHISTLPKLESLNFNYCKLLTGKGIEEMTKTLVNLKQLEMNGCDHGLTEMKVRPLILLAEDSKVQARMISMVLNRYNFDVEVATNGEMALDMYRANPRYNLILMDVVMPVMDGPTCVKQIREYEAQRGLKPTPIIIQTADDRESQRNTCIEAGCDGFMPKPLDKSCISMAKELMSGKNRSSARSFTPGSKKSRTSGQERKSMESAAVAAASTVNNTNSDQPKSQ